MQWDNSPHAGFTAGTPLLPVNTTYREINAAAQAGDPDSVLSYYRRLIGLRHDLPVVSEGDFTLLLPDDERIWAFTRHLGTTGLLVLANLSAGPAEAAIPEDQDWAAAELLLSNYPPPAGGAPARRMHARDRRQRRGGPRDRHRGRAPRAPRVGARSCPPRSGPEPFMPSFPRPGRAPRPLTSRAVAGRCWPGLALLALLAAGCTARRRSRRRVAQDPASPIRRPPTAPREPRLERRAAGHPLPPPARPAPPRFYASASPGSGSGNQSQQGQVTRTPASPAPRREDRRDRPGHNGGNFSHPADMAKQIWNGRADGGLRHHRHQTNAGYTEARFTFRVPGSSARTAQGWRPGGDDPAHQHRRRPVRGPAVRILNHGDAQVSIDIHGDGGPPNGRGFAILLPSLTARTAT
jgi:hypothetical protein